MEFEIEKELANIVCIFVSPNEPGIMFYDRSPEPGSPEAKFAGSLPEGKYLTDHHSISKTEWDEEMNVENGDRIVRFREGSTKVTTIIVTKEQMKDIVASISNCDDPDRIVIDTGRRFDYFESKHEKNINDTDYKTKYDNFKQARDNVMKSMEQYKHLNDIDTSEFDNTNNSSNKGLK